jgi:hypothetical protein
MFESNTNSFAHCANDYLSKCDRINKLSLNNVKKGPQIKNVILSLSLGEASSVMNDSFFRDKRLMSFLMLYLIGFRKPISFVSRPTKISDESFFKQEILLSKKSAMHEFLLDLFLEDKLVLEKESNVEKDEFSQRLSEKKAAILKSKIALESFLSINKFVEKESIDTKYKKLELTIEVVIQNFEVEV